jgi:hypothetical protein
MRKRVTTNLLDISYEENGNENSLPVILLHGFPDDAKTTKNIFFPVTTNVVLSLMPDILYKGKNQNR